MALRDPSQLKLLQRTKGPFRLSQSDYSKTERSSIDGHRFTMGLLCQSLGLTAPSPEYQFVSDRKWRFDYAWPAYKVAVEVDGGILTGGRHTSSISGRLRDIEKLNTAASMGWRVLIASTLHKPICDKRKKVLPWLALEDPKFQEMLKQAILNRFTM
jgi:hypothetical protein